jgi:uncharacterized alkaline shock family protein YloU
VAEWVISPAVIAAIGAHAAAATPGVVRLEGGVSALLAGLGRTVRNRVAGITPYPASGASATVTDGHTSLRVSVAVSGSRRVADTAAAVQRSVAYAVAAGTGLKVAGVHVAVVDIVVSTGSTDTGSTDTGSTAPSRTSPGGTSRDGDVLSSGLTDFPVPKGDSRAEAGAAVLYAIRSVPGLRPASPVRQGRSPWMPFDPAMLAVGLDDGLLEVQLAATRLPLPPLLEQAAAAVRQATERTRWGALPHRLVVTALDAVALITTTPASPWGEGDPND